MIESAIFQIFIADIDSEAILPVITFCTESHNEEQLETFEKLFLSCIKNKNFYRTEHLFKTKTSNKFLYFSKKGNKFMLFTSKHDLTLFEASSFLNKISEKLISLDIKNIDFNRLKETLALEKSNFEKCLNSKREILKMQNRKYTSQTSKNEYSQFKDEKDAKCTILDEKQRNQQIVEDYDNIIVTTAASSTEDVVNQYKLKDLRDDNLKETKVKITANSKITVPQKINQQNHKFSCLKKIILTIFLIVLAFAFASPFIFANMYSSYSVNNKTNKFLDNEYSTKQAIINNTAH